MGHFNCLDATVYKKHNYITLGLLIQYFAKILWFDAIARAETLLYCSFHKILLIVITTAFNQSSVVPFNIHKTWKSYILKVIWNIAIARMETLWQIPQGFT